MRYIPNSAQQRAEMLREMGRDSVDELFRGIPEHLKVPGLLNLPARATFGRPVTRSAISTASAVPVEPS